MSKITKRYLADTVRFRRFLFEGVLWMFVASGVQLTLPQFIRAMLDQYIPNHQIRPAFSYFCLIIGLFLVRALVVIRRNNRMLNFGYGFVYHMRLRLMRHLQLLSGRYYDQTSIGDIMTRMLDDIMNIEFMTTNSVLEIVTNAVIVLGVLGMLFHMNWRLALAGLFVMPFYLLNYIYFRPILRQRNRDIQRNYSGLTSEFNESVSGIRVIKSFSLEKFREKRIEQFFLQDVSMRIRTYTLNAVFMVISEFLTILGTATVLLYGGYLVMNHTITIGEVVAFYTYIGYMYGPLLVFVNMTQIIQRGLASLERVYEVLDTNPWPPEKPTAREPQDVKGEIEFDRINFTYTPGQKTTLKDISFKAEAGKTIALVGANGAGKSTIMNLILRFYDPQEGRISLDGMDLRDLKIESLRRQLSMVWQEPFIFSGTIYDNVCIGRLEAKKWEVEQALMQARAWDFVSEFPQGTKTLLGDKGIRLSGGQRQLLVIARAILRNTPIILLDEPTAAMDNETEYLVRESLSNLCRNRTTIIIAHRLITIRTVDQILVMKEGEIVQRGNHQSLMAGGGYYRKLYELQFSGQDVA